MIVSIEDYARLIEQGTLCLFELQQLHTRVPEGTRPPDLVGAGEKMGCASISQDKSYSRNFLFTDGRNEIQ